MLRQRPQSIQQDNGNIAASERKHQQGYEETEQQERINTRFSHEASS